MVRKKRYDWRHSSGYKNVYHPPKPSKKVKLPTSAKQKIFPAVNAKNNKSLVVRECPQCHNLFATYKSLTKTTKTSFCSKQCYLKGRTVVSRYKFRTGKSKGAVKKILNRPGVFKHQKEKYADKIIKYKESPTGQAYIGIAKRPLMPTSTGIGYQGVLIQDENREFVQCSGCGKWFQKIGNSHTQKCLGLTTREYKVKFGLNLMPGLVSDETSQRLTKACLKNKEGIERFSKNPPIGNKYYARRKGSKSSIEFMNSRATCPAQLKARLYEFINVNRELPSSNNRGKSIYKALTKRYGKWGIALKSHGLPFFVRKGTNMKYIFPDGSKYEYNINRWGERLDLFQMLKKKCPVLSYPIQNE